MSQLVVFNVDFPGGIDTNNIKFRAVLWIGSELFLWAAIMVNLVSPRNFRYVLWSAAAVMMVDWAMTLIWLVSNHGVFRQLAKDSDAD